MAHATSAAIWTIDTSSIGLVNSSPVFINSILVTWKSGSAGTLLIQEQNGTSQSTAMNPLLSAKTLGATSAGWDQMTQQFFYDRIFQNLWLTTATNIDSVYIITE